uniref:Uncharacterized protein n=1 Tax=Arundo donax TaxID=35708 RepID=A0A0A9A7V6_ARUDO
MNKAIIILIKLTIKLGRT